MLAEYTTIPEENLMAVAEEEAPVMATAFEALPERL